MPEQIFDESVPPRSDFVDAIGQTGFVDQDGDFFGEGEVETTAPLAPVPRPKVRLR